MPSALVLIADGTEEMELSVDLWKSNYPHLLKLTAPQHNRVRHSGACRGEMYFCSRHATRRPRRICARCRPVLSWRPHCTGCIAVSAQCIHHRMCLFYRPHVGALHDGDMLQGEYDAIVIPGGLKGAETISQSSLVQSLVKTFYEKRKLIGMICAGKGIRLWR